MSTSHEIANDLKPQNRLHRAEDGPAILIVDDDLDFLDLIADRVARIPGATVAVASSCDEAVDNLTQQRFHLVICDWALATRTGPEVFSLADPLLTRFRGMDVKVPVIFMSGSEKVTSTQNLRSFKYFAPVTFIIKNLGPHVIGVMAEHVLEFFNPSDGGKRREAYLS
jgi:DNA-binding NtrC family response regulator